MNGKPLSKATLRRNARRAEFLIGASCVRCGSTKRLEFDHIDPATKLGDHIWTWAEKAFRAEAACQWLCRPCHLDKSVADRRRPDWQRSPAAIATFTWLKQHGFMVANDNRPATAANDNVQLVEEALKTP